MPTILQSALPEALQNQPALPGTRPCPPDDWLMVDDAYAAQMAYRADLLRDKRDAVFYAPDAVLDPARELLDEVLGLHRVPLELAGEAVQPIEVWPDQVVEADFGRERSSRHVLLVRTHRDTVQ